MKKPETILREYVNRASDETLKFLAGRLGQRLCGDTPEALDALSQANDMDRLLSNAKSAWELYDLLDNIQDAVERELRKRMAEDKEVSVTTVETDDNGAPRVRRKRFSSKSSD